MKSRATHSIITNTSISLKTTSNAMLGEIILSEAVPFLSIIMYNTIWSSLIVIEVTWSHEQNGRKVFRVNGVSYVVFYEQNLLLDKLVTTSHSNKNRFPSIFSNTRSRWILEICNWWDNSLIIRLAVKHFHRYHVVCLKTYKNCIRV